MRQPRAEAILDALPEDVVEGFEEALAELVRAAAEGEEEEQVQTVATRGDDG